VRALLKSRLRHLRDEADDTENAPPLSALESFAALCEHTVSFAVSRLHTHVRNAIVSYRSLFSSDPARLQLDAGARFDILGAMSSAFGYLSATALPAHVAPPTLAVVLPLTLPAGSCPAVANRALRVVERVCRMQPGVAADSLQFLVSHALPALRLAAAAPPESPLRDWTTSLRRATVCVLQVSLLVVPVPGSTRRLSVGDLSAEMSALQLLADYGSDDDETDGDGKDQAALTAAWALFTSPGGGDMGAALVGLCAAEDSAVLRALASLLEWSVRVQSDFPPFVPLSLSPGFRAVCLLFVLPCQNDSAGGSGSSDERVTLTRASVPGVCAQRCL
jgi:hypothetical protein